MSNTSNEQNALKTPKSALKTEINISTYDGKIVRVSSLRLKRRLLKDAYNCSIYFPEGHWRMCNKVGVPLNVTWDEVIRGMVSLCLSRPDLMEELPEFIPALT